MRITAAEIRRLAPKASAKIVDGIVDNQGLLAEHGINTPLRVAHFMAQLAHESAGFKTAREYASGKAYEGRKDLGNTQRGDGVRFRGRGLIQITGRANAKAAGKALGQPYEAQPTLMEEFPHALLVSIWYWNSRKLNALADKDDVRGITKKINGGYNGLEDRKAYLAKAKSIWGSGPAAKPSRPPAKSDALTKDEIKALQKRLYDLAYFEVGKADGLWGSKTTAAIAAFQDEHSIPISGRLDDATRQALATATPRQVSPARKATTMADLRASGSRTVKESDQVTTGASVGIAGGATAVVGSAANYVANNFSSTRDTLSPFMDFFSDIPLWVYGAAIIALCLFMYWKANRVRELRLEDEQTGKTAGQPDPSPSPPVEFEAEDPSEIVEA